MVKIGSNARIIIPPNVVIQQENLKDDHAIVNIRFVFNTFINFIFIYKYFVFICIFQAETITYPDPLDQQDVEPVPIWIIIVAVVAGLLLFILLTLVLRKLGFFKRRRPDPTLSGNLEKHRDDNPENEALFKH